MSILLIKKFMEADIDFVELLVYTSISILSSLALAMSGIYILGRSTCSSSQMQLTASVVYSSLNV